MEKAIKLTAASAAHFLVDFACAFAMFRLFFGGERWGMLLLLYNFCAFALQMPIGLLADRWNRNFLLAAIGCGVVACGYLPLPEIAAVTLLGSGNAAFHVGGGLEILTQSPDRAGQLGVFVSPGAIGLYVGTVLGKDALLSTAAPVILMLAAGASLLLTQRTVQTSFRSDNAPPALPRVKSVLVPLACLFAVVIWRSMVGMGLSLDWKTGGWGFAAVLALALGKAAGGYLADAWGFQKTANVSLAAAAVLFFFAEYPVCGLAAIFLFNMTMPLTLYAAARKLPGAKGFAFGLLTFALFLGFLPAYYGVGEMTQVAAAALALLSAVALWGAVRT
ncbi:MAG: hypothetical protein LKJ86_10420 [Oscillibacter sp.]|jgi:FSR family fosmidomycin resistance protein-like MFS transporter|nr:hypothetical protein [Oscillibacter sp.]